MKQGRGPGRKDCREWYTARCKRRKVGNPFRYPYMLGYTIVVQNSGKSSQCLSIANNNEASTTVVSLPFDPAVQRSWSSRRSIHGRNAPDLGHSRPGMRPKAQSTPPVSPGRRSATASPPGTSCSRPRSTPRPRPASSSRRLLPVHDREQRHRGVGPAGSGAYHHLGARVVHRHGPAPRGAASWSIRRIRSGGRA